MQFFSHNLDEIKPGDLVIEHTESRQGIMALAFAEKLIKGDFDAAHRMLASNLRSSISPAQLKAKYEAMIEYGDGPPLLAAVTGIMDDWSEKKETDVGWAYVSISGSDYLEAVTVIVSEEEKQLVISQIEWGRP